MSEDAISSPSPPVGGVENPLVDVNDPQPVGTLSSLELDAYQSVSRPASQISNLLSTVGNQSQQDTWQACSYTMSFRRPIFEFMSSHCKQTIELVAGQKLSWWPLSDPEDSLAPGFTRVYSKQFVSVLASISKSIIGDATDNQLAVTWTILRRYTQPSRRLSIPRPGTNSRRCPACTEGLVGPRDRPFRTYDTNAHHGPVQGVSRVQFKSATGNGICQ